MSRQAGLPAMDALEPAAVWRFFAEIAATPRPSKQEERIRAYVRAEAKERGLKVREDQVGNLVIEAPASPGCERAPITVLQGHLDMVCEKNADVPHDFERDPVPLVVDEDSESGEIVVRAKGTTLGADNGIGVAMGLVAATSPEVVHGPLEILLTVDEEMGMTGAGFLKSDSFRGRRLINLDSEEDDAVYIGCAGGGDVNLSWVFERSPIVEGAEICQVGVTGLRGGHSGGDIQENRGNAIKLLARAIQHGGCEGLRIVDIGGGNKRNAIPREASAVVAGPAGTCEALTTAAKEVCEVAACELPSETPAIKVKPVTGHKPTAAISIQDTRKLLAALTALPHGVLEMHPQIAGLVQTSNNVATITAEPTEGEASLYVEVGCLSRSSVDSRMEATRDQILSVGQLAGAAVEKGHSYPGWEPRMDSALLGTCRDVYARLFNEQPRVLAIHAGLECGIIGQRVGEVDMVSFGPRIEGAHSPEERVYVVSVQKTWKYLMAVLAELAKA
ncbi:MAG: aminoacyl-histidine dipeptidase [Phycisphaerales bacterium]|nr:MAG: aminoacyl-histidine dipeptidase [Phycisphaerales bacterium]